MVDALACRVADHVTCQDLGAREGGRFVDDSMLLAHPVELDSLYHTLVTNPSEVRCGLVHLGLSRDAHGTALSPTVVVTTPMDKFLVRLQNLESTCRARGLIERALPMVAACASPTWLARQLHDHRDHAYISMFPRPDLDAPCVRSVSLSRGRLQVAICDHPQLREHAEATKHAPPGATLFVDASKQFMAIVSEQNEALSTEFFTLRTVDAVEASAGAVIVPPCQSVHEFKAQVVQRLNLTN